MTGAQYASVEDLKAHWPEFDPDLHPNAEHKLFEAEVQVLTEYPDLPQRIESGATSRAAVILGLCRMVKRALTPPVPGMENVGSTTAQAGPFSQTVSFVGQGDGSLFMRKEDRRLFAGTTASRRDGKAFTVPLDGARC